MGIEFIFSYDLYAGNKKNYDKLCEFFDKRIVLKLKKNINGKSLIDDNSIKNDFLFHHCYSTYEKNIKELQITFLCLTGGRSLDHNEKYFNNLKQELDLDDEYIPECSELANDFDCSCDDISFDEDALHDDEKNCKCEDCVECGYCEEYMEYYNELIPV